MKKQKKEKHFLKLPQYPGGKESFNKFLRENLRYPEEALKNGIEGDVHLTFDIDHNGKVINVKVVHGLGYGCDEEAVRLIEMLRYEKAKNRGVKVKASKKIRIPFRLKKTNIGIQYNYQVKSKPTTDQEDKDQKKDGGSYSYTINIS